MPEKPEISQPVDVLASIRNSLGAEESLAQLDLHHALVEANVSSDLAEVYGKLEPRPGTRQGIGLISKAILITFGTSTAARLISESPASVQEATRIVLDNFVAWAGTSIDRLELTSIILGASAAAAWTLLPPKIYEGIVKREAVRVNLASEHQEGRANLAGKLGPNVQIDAGKSDPSVLLLTRLFHLSDKEVVTYWDERNPQFTENPYWERTRNDWTNAETLKRGDIEEAICSIVLVSSGDDVFLSTRRQDPTRQAQDMTDPEAIGTVNARDTVRKQMGLPPIHHILVTNPQREIEIDVARGGGEVYKPKTIGEVVRDKYPNVHIIDLDELIVNELARMTSADKLPLELVTNRERRKEYEDYLNDVVTEHNLRVDQSLTRNKTRVATAEDGKNTLTIMYGSTDEDTIAIIETYGDEFSQIGDMVAIINDPEKVSRLPEGVKYVCVGTVVAEAVYKEFSDLVKQEKIPF